MLTKFLPRAKESPYSILWDYVKRNPETSVLSDIETGLTKVRNGDYILIASFKDVVNAIAESCVYDKVGNGFYPYQSGLPVRRGMIFLPGINDNIANLRDTGILHDLELKWFENIEDKCEKTESTLTSGDGGQLDLKAFIGMYVFLALGMTGGVIICLFETLSVKYGGLRGILGKSRFYEFRKDHYGFQKPSRVMDDEFENWPGGWNVLKHKPFIEQQQLGKGKIPVDTLPCNSSSKISEDATMCCPECGMENEDLHRIIQKRKQSMAAMSSKPVFVNTVEDTISLETGYRSGSALSQV
uniref:Ionotropic glutamate receptor C-terminal domain-containing protein n=1 Tax=Ciona savignyi TaxID=51511 RepID=H2YPT1_CIOSA